MHKAIAKSAFSMIQLNQTYQLSCATVDIQFIIIKINTYQT